VTRLTCNVADRYEHQQHQWHQQYGTARFPSWESHRNVFTTEVTLRGQGEEKARKESTYEFERKQTDRKKQEGKTRRLFSIVR